MPIFSYLVHPRPGSAQSVARALTALESCEVMPSEDGSLLVLLTDTPNDEAHQALEAELAAVPDVLSLTMVFGHSETEELYGELNEHRDESTQ